MKPVHRLTCLLGLLLVGVVLPRAAADDKPKSLQDALNEIQQKAQEHDLNGAIRRCEEVLKELRNQYRREDPRATFFLNELGMLHKANGEYEKAAKELEECLDLRQQNSKTLPLHVALSKRNLADLYRLRADYRQAEENFQSSLADIEWALANLPTDQRETFT
jgi:tetratricopeptide (TPR) repeat protein